MLQETLLNMLDHNLNDPFLRIYENALSEQFCKEVIEKFETDGRKTNGVVHGGYKPEVKQSIDLPISKLHDWNEVDQVLFNSLNKHFNQYMEDLPDVVENWGWGQLKDTGYQIQKTCPGGFYTWHHDSIWNTYREIRILTFIWYLNDVEEGHTEFISGIKIQPKLGRLLLFPASWNYVHTGTPPKTDKYIVTGWMSLEIG